MLPCLDEAAALPWVLERMPPGYRPIVVDNGSSDGSPDIARAYGVRVVSATPRGYGAACHIGLTAASASVVCVLDCDGSLDPRELPRLVEPLLRREADLAVGRRRPTTRAAWPLPARLGNAALARALRRRGVSGLHDIGPARAGWREALISLGVRDRRFGYPLELLVRAGDAGWTIREYDVSYRPRIGKSKVTGTVRGTVRTVRDMRRVLAA